LSSRGSEDVDKLYRLLENLEKRRSDDTIDDGVYQRLKNEYSNRIRELTGVAPAPSLGGVEGPPIGAAAAPGVPRILDVQVQQNQHLPPAAGPRARRQGETAAMIAIAVAMLITVLLAVIFIAMH